MPDDVTPEQMKAVAAIEQIEMDLIELREQMRILQSKIDLLQEQHRRILPQLPLRARIDRLFR
ncbi:MAG TPA: hypothetical protein VGR57_15860 [Ktedonobacterales bacterium]|nr:hypothetical protein [Ktedonobacterales bacterium]